MKYLFVLAIFLLPSISWSQAKSPSETKKSNNSKALTKHLRKSQVINGETFDLEFIIIRLPDNSWILKLNKDSTFEYIHWSGWSDSDGDVLEYGEYKIKNNLLELKSNEIDSKLNSSIYYIIATKTDKIDGLIQVDCTESASKTYCLYVKR